MLSCEPGQVLIEAAISMGRMWVAVPDRDTFLFFKLALEVFLVFVPFVVFLLMCLTVY